MDVIEADVDDGNDNQQNQADDNVPPPIPPSEPMRLDGLDDDEPKKQRHAAHVNSSHYTREEIQYFLQNQKEMRVYPKWRGVFVHPELKTLGKYVKRDMWAEVVPEEDIETVLENIYKNPKLGYSGGQKLWTYVWQHYLGITSRDVREFLKKYETHQLHQGIHAAHVTKPIIVSRPGRHWQMDLANLWEYRHHNKGMTYLLVVIDVNSKYIFAEPVKRKFPENVLPALKNIIKEIEQLGLDKPALIQSDNGGEFLGVVDDYLKQQGIKHILSTSHNPRSQAVVERSNGTLKRMIGRWMTDNATRRWTDVLPDIIENYNNSYHSTIRMTPKQALLGDEKTERKVYGRLKKAANKLERRLKTQPQLKIGDYVRLSLVKEDHNERKLYQSGFRKTGSVVNWSKEIFKVVGVASGEQNGHVPMRESYKVAKLDNTKLKGRYFRHHLLKTVAPDDVIAEVDKPSEDIAKLDEEYKNRQFDDDAEQKEQVEAHLEREKKEPVALRLRKRPPKADLPDEKDDDDEKKTSDGDKKSSKDEKKPKSIKIRKAKPSDKELEHKYDDDSDGERDDKDDKKKSDDELYVPERILAEKKHKGKKLYKIKWMGYPVSESTWEPLRNIVRGRDELLKTWEESKNKSLKVVKSAKSK